ncbi:ester cyclase [Phenylobacterium sp.]|jgi:predicted ester cyclase|uniref:ester cyclase n=1 Tax=Phenylobacterium sp. TaxID=1871053 RepID=UPI002F95E4D9
MSASRLLPVVIGASFLAPLPAVAATPEAVVRGFLADVRSGRHPDLADQYLASSVRAHQVTSEGEAVVVRTPADYAAHVREFLALYGDFAFEVVECLAADDRVYVRWRQTGRHLASQSGERPTGAPLTDISSAVYRVRGGRIVEYWIQTDRLGMDLQVRRAVAQAAAR